MLHRPSIFCATKSQIDFDSDPAFISKADDARCWEGDVRDRLQTDRRQADVCAACRLMARIHRRTFRNSRHPATCASFRMSTSSPLPLPYQGTPPSPTHHRIAKLSLSHPHLHRKIGILKSIIAVTKQTWRTSNNESLLKRPQSGIAPKASEALAGKAPQIPVFTCARDPNLPTTLSHYQLTIDYRLPTISKIDWQLFGSGDCDVAI